MKRVLFAFLSLGLVCSDARKAFTQESPENELEMVRQLRQKGWTDLAKQKIEFLAKTKDPFLIASLPLESARINITIARQIDPEQRFGLFTEARKQLGEFIQKNKGKVEAALASAELARVTSYHGQALLTKAMREEDNKTRHEKARPAEAMFIQAGKDLEAAELAIKQALPNAQNSTLKAALEKEAKEVRLDKATNLFDQARTYIDRGKEAVNAARSEVLAKAQKALKELSNDNSTTVGLLANAWLMKCAMEMDAPDEVKAYQRSVMNKKDNKEAAPAVRLVRFFHMQDIAMARPEDTEAIGRNPTNAKMKPLDRLRAVQKEGESWLKAYPSYKKTYEGQGVLFELALSFYQESQLDSGKKVPDKKLAAANLAKAETRFKELAELDGDLSEKARGYQMFIESQRIGTLKELKTFDQNIMKAMLARNEVRKVNAELEQPKLGDKTKLEEERKKALKSVIKSLNAALALADAKTPVVKIDDARNLLSGAYLAYGDPYRAAIAAESLGRSKPPTRHSADGAATAIQTYAALQARQPDNAVLRKRLEDMAQYVLSPELQRTWGADPVTSLAHYHLAMEAKRDNNPKKAIQHLEKIAPDFVDYIYTQGQIVFLAQDAGEKADDKEKKLYLTAAMKALDRMPKLTPKEDNPSVIVMYFYAKMEKAKLLFSDAMEELKAKHQELPAIKKCNDMAKYVKELRSEFDQPLSKKISIENRDQIEFTMNVMLKYADLGIAEANFRHGGANRFDQVVKATSNVVNQVLAKAKSTPANEPIRLKDYDVTGKILGLALRASVQKGDVSTGKAILDVLKRLKGTQNDNAGAGNIVAVLLGDIAAQVQRAVKDKDPDLPKTKKNYVAFLDEIGNQYDKSGWENNAVALLGHAYTSLEMPCKAAAVFVKVKAPPDLDKKVAKKATGKETDKEIEENQRWEAGLKNYWGAQIEYARALRGCKEDKEARKTAEKVLETMLKHPNARYQVQAMMERYLLVEDQEEYRKAYGGWNAFMKMPSLTRDLANKDTQKVYFDGYFYSVRTLYKTAMYDKKIQDRKKLIVGAANMIIKLEYSTTQDGWNLVGPKFQELIRSEPMLKEEYDKLKALREKSK